MTPNRIRRAVVVVALTGLVAAVTVVTGVPAAGEPENPIGQETGCAAGVSSIAVAGAELDTRPGAVRPSDVVEVIDVSGRLSLCEDALEPRVVADDPAGDATVASLGFDIGALTLQTDVVNRVVTFTMRIHDGNPPPGLVPGRGFQWPIRVGGQNWPRWLGAGTVGTNFPPRTESWTGVCVLNFDGWACEDDVPGAITGTEVRWDVRFDAVQVGDIAPFLTRIKFGTVVSSDRYQCGVPCSFVWPSFFMATWQDPWNALAVDVVDDDIAAYKVPGEIRIGLAPADMPEVDVNYTDLGTWDPTDDAFSGTIAAPDDSGSYRVWVKSCHGLVNELSCVTDNIPAP